MKQETMLAKMNALLGITEEAEVIIQQKVEKEKGLLGDLPEHLIQQERTLQGILLYLRAPQLFTTQICLWHECQQPFMVSRRLIVYCSYTCMRHHIQWEGYEWTKGEGIEFDEKRMLEFIQDRNFINGNEPIWIRDLDKLQEALTKLSNFLDQHQKLQSTNTVPEAIPS